MGGGARVVRGGEGGGEGGSRTLFDNGSFSALRFRRPAETGFRSASRRWHEAIKTAPISRQPSKIELGFLG